MCSHLVDLGQVHRYGRLYDGDGSSSTSAHPELQLWLPIQELGTASHTYRGDRWESILAVWIGVYLHWNSTLTTAIPSLYDGKGEQRDTGWSIVINPIL